MTDSGQAREKLLSTLLAGANSPTKLNFRVNSWGHADMTQTIFYPTARLTFAGIIALVTTFLLFFFMHYLIQNKGAITVEDPVYYTTLEYIRIKEEEPPPKIKKLEPPPEPADQPPAPVIDSLDKVSLTDSAIEITGPGKMIITEPAGPNTFANNGDVISIVKFPAVYPHNAVTRGIEGYTIVEFTVTTTGTTKDIRVIEATPPNIFDKASIKATSKFKFKPRIVKGVPVEVHGIKNKFTFKLTDN